ncbi:MAG: anaerobic ribonucleoside-triphosphate reductase activating protein [Candidatus ainarchaeum sp.]|nr:anaerobic ribonucleoside-triphosphate reductase activating protein [Candidatus ainarchaeum sp.]
MFIGGLEKLTLTDFPDKTACIVFLVNCNFKCPFCYNKELTSNNLFKKSKRKLIPEEEFFLFLKENKKMLDGVVITGGEPTLSPGLINFIKKIKTFNLLVKLDTNGSNPLILGQLINEKLIDYIAMDIKSPLENYSSFVRSNISQKSISDSINLIKSSTIPHEFRTTLYPKLTVDDFKNMSKLIEGENWFLQEFWPTNTFSLAARKLKPMRKNKIDKIISICSKSTNIKLRGLDKQ